MDGIAAISTRITQIQTALASFTPRTATATAGTAAAAFASALASEVAIGAATPAASGALTADGAPAELAAYGNGQIPAAALDEIGSTGHRLWAPASGAFERLSAAAAADGVAITITDSYRSYASQVDVADRKGLYSNGGLAAVPGTSDHGWGRSLDLGLDASALAWMRENAARYGFAEDTPRETWHWTYSS
ncbi:M15 family metallopeptidase [Pengzhenrongella sicca]|uniref:M15 family metallopeptidase n=1 Tax=Pengzhenrongella sicca TaxID=2819238 RepID=A0A8A4Z7P1_9MICO|nr:M15 family metallopeptidase [Pengzhenrongella sicca]QTE27862.1 M15 family metallopeptidase [Pengzhenrongella sicca]